MKKTIRTVALISLLSLTAVGCQKEDVINYMAGTSILETEIAHTMRYEVDGMLHESNIQSDAERTVLMQRLFAMVKDGHEVVLYGRNTNGQHFATKEVIRYTTTDEKDAIAWTEKMSKSGYDVKIKLDPERKVYVCVAWTRND